MNLHTFTRRPRVPQPYLLFDADTLLYRAAWVFQKDQFGDGTCLSVDGDGAREFIEQTVNRTLELSECSFAVMALSDSRNFRKEDVLPSYKSNRRNVKKPEPLLSELREWTVGKFYTVVEPRLEADDVCGILATRDTVVLWSVDKDLNMIPGLHWDPDMCERYTVDPDTADLWFHMQVLTGDPGDGYPGCPKVGPKKAAQALQGVPREGRWAAVVDTYLSKGLQEDDAITQARCARILTQELYDIHEQKVTPWKPTTCR